MLEGRRGLRKDVYCHSAPESRLPYPNWEKKGVTFVSFGGDIKPSVLGDLAGVHFDQPKLTCCRTGLWRRWRCGKNRHSYVREKEGTSSARGLSINRVLDPLHYPSLLTKLTEAREGYQELFQGKLGMYLERYYPSGTRLRSQLPWPSLQPTSMNSGDSGLWLSPVVGYSMNSGDSGL